MIQSNSCCIKLIYFTIQVHEVMLDVTVPIQIQNVFGLLAIPEFYTFTYQFIQRWYIKVTDRVQNLAIVRSEKNLAGLDNFYKLLINPQLRTKQMGKTDCSFFYCSPRPA